MVEGANGVAIPTVARRQLAREIVQLRKFAGMTQVAAATKMEWSQAKLWRLEKAESNVVVTSRDIAALAQLYKAGKTKTSNLMLLHKRMSDFSGDWISENEEIPEWFRVYAGMEQMATRFREYHSELVTGVFQTPDYALTVIRANAEGDPKVSDREIQERLEIRLRRADILHRVSPPAPKLMVVLNEAIIRRPVGGPLVMAEQLRHLAKVSELSNVDLRILPFSAGMHRGALAAGSFVILDFAEDDEPTTVYSEALTGSAYLQDADASDRYIWAWEGILPLSLDPEKSRELLINTAKEFAS